MVMIVVVVVCPVLQHFVFYHTWCVDRNANSDLQSEWDLEKYLTFNQTDLGRKFMASAWWKSFRENVHWGLSESAGLGIRRFVYFSHQSTRLIVFGFVSFDSTGDHWPQTTDGDGEPSDWRSWEEAHQEGGGHQRAERTGQGHWRPQVRFLVTHLLIWILWYWSWRNVSHLLAILLKLSASYFLNHRKLGASEGTINQEIQRYQQLESVAVNDIRRDVRKKLRRSSMRVNAHPFSFPT